METSHYKMLRLRLAGQYRLAPKLLWINTSTSSKTVSPSDTTPALTSISETTNLLETLVLKETKK
jgi:hypothetical protein